jgi:hypothetical protein
MLTDKTYRAKIISNCDDIIVKQSWTLINNLDPKQAELAFATLVSKIGTLLMSPTIRNIVGQPHSTFSLTQGKVVIANLDRAKLGDYTAKLLGALLIARSSGQVYINDIGFFASDYLASLLQQDRFAVSLSYLAEARRSPLFTDALLSIQEKVILRTHF